MPALGRMLPATAGNPEGTSPPGRSTGPARSAGTRVLTLVFPLFLAFVVGFKLVRLVHAAVLVFASSLVVLAPAFVQAGFASEFFDVVSAY